MNCAEHPLVPPKVVAVAHDRTITPFKSFADRANLPGVLSPQYGQDLSFGIGRAAPGNKSVGSRPNELIPKMRKLLEVFAKGDHRGMATRLFDKFLAKQSAVTYFDDGALSDAASSHPNITYFVDCALSAPNSTHQSAERTRVHAALRNVGWDINKLVAPTALGVPAFNLGSKAFSTRDFNNGLGLMINGVQHAYVVAQNYHYDPKAARYCILLKYVFYDVFGLDDVDLDRFGASSASALQTAAGIGITAWWQLQHQHGYAPLVTRIILTRAFEAPAT